MKSIYKKNFYILDNEFTQMPHEEYNNLNILKDLGSKERIIGLINDIQYTCNVSKLLCLDSTHGGYIPIKCSENLNKTTIVCNDIHYDNINNNVNEMDINLNKNIMVLDNKRYQFGFHFDKNPFLNYKNSLLIYSENSYIDNLNTYLELNPIILVHKNNIKHDNKDYNKNKDNDKDNITINNSEILLAQYYHDKNKFSIKDSDLLLYIPDIFLESFYSEFKYYIECREKNILNYDNLINLCIMVKNAGPQFEDTLNKNMHLIDRWTILDTGSTDGTIDIINKVLVGKKKGKLYQEPFINFRDSRNRLLELSGETCKYTLMLDDTYTIEGDLRDFLNIVRGDQFSDSFTLYIKSDDVEYGSNRVLISDRKLKYIHKIHEVITPENNKNVVIPIRVAHIVDGRFDYMEKRTMDRKKLDLKLLQEEIDEDPENPRSYYYMGQTYNLLEEHQLAFDYFIKRMNCKREGFIQEKIDAVFEAARIANFKLNKPWKECEKLYLTAYELDNSRPDSLYFLGIHYFMENEKKQAFDYFKKAFEIGYPLHCQYSLKPTLSYHFLPRYLTQLCYEFGDNVLGEQSALLFLQNNKPESEYYEVILSWYQIFVNLNKLHKNPNSTFNDISLRNKDSKPYLVFLADGGFSNWSGSYILKNGVGGSETYIIEMARYIQRHGFFQVIVFCKCEQSEIFEGVEYLHIDNYFDFISNKYVHTAIISRFSEYYPATIEGNVDNIYLIAHDLSFTGCVIPIHSKLKKIFCLSEWHVSYMTNTFPQLKNYLVPFYYGIDFDKFLSNNIILKQKNKFIYSSFPNRGLLELLQMWPKIYNRYPDASLHIFCDLDNEWVNKVAPEKIQKIKLVLNDLQPLYNVCNYGWVSKKRLAEEWLTSEYWLYPCTFAETFCLTALEAAITKTLPITNNLAALQNTVSNRGIVVEGDPTTEEWQSKTLLELFKVMDNPERKETLIKKNYDWSLNLSWEKQANKLLNEYLLKNKIQYCGMFNWTNDLPSKEDRVIFVDFINHFNKKNINEKPKILEVGTYAGVSLLHIVALIPNSIGYGVDKWEDYYEEAYYGDNKKQVEVLSKINSNNVKKVFEYNTRLFGLNDRIIALQGDSTSVLLDLISDKNNNIFDFIYVDGSHKCLDVFNDCVLSWKLLAKGGFMVIDDYMYNIRAVKEDPLEYPFHGVNHFLEKYKNEIKIFSKGYRVFIEKI